MKIEAILVWILASLLAISFVGDHPFLGLAIAIVGGVVAAIVLVIDALRGKESKK